MQVTSSLIGGRFPKSMKRALPIYIAVALIFILFLSKTDNLNTPLRAGDVFKRVVSYQSPLLHQKKYGETFPKKIWQTWKTDPLEFETRDSDRARSWTSKNPGHRYEVLTDANSQEYIETHFGPSGLNRMDVVYIYKTLNATIIKADLLRYLVMYIEGGVYADIDVSAIKPVDDWITPAFPQKDVGLVISVEIDEPNFFSHPILGPKSESFCQWTFMAKPRHPVMLRLINNVLKWLEEIAKKQNVGIAEIELNFDEVLTGTGPSAFTSAVMAEMYAQTGEVQKWDKFHNMTQRGPTQVGDILVLTVEAFAAGQGHSNSNNHDHPLALVRHHYHASLWPSRHPRYSHPAYGMVEECNWKPDCIEKWDKDKDNYINLTEEQKKEAIGHHEEWLAEKDKKEKQEKADREKEEDDKRREKLRPQCETLRSEDAASSASVAATATTESSSQAAKPAENTASATPSPDAKRDTQGENFVELKQL